MNCGTLLAFIGKYGVLTSQWTWLYEALLEVSMTKIALWVRACADDWAAESAIKASIEVQSRFFKKNQQKYKKIFDWNFV